MGTRLKSAVPHLPKCMAPVAGRPFLSYVIDHLQKQGVDSFIFSLGYRHEVIENFIGKAYPQLQAQFSTEDEPLGTGGAVLLACGKTNAEDVLVLNGDTLFNIDVQALLNLHRNEKAACTLALKPMQDFDRYGVVEINETGRIQSFREKQFYPAGLINGGMYALNVPAFLSTGLPRQFSFEKDYLEKYHATQKMLGQVEDAYFIDIGIPEDLARANRELAD